MRFKKSVLKVGRRVSPDGIVDITPERLKHWEGQHQRLTKASQVVPIDWDHASTEDALKPLTMDAYKKKRSAKNTVGRLAEFKVAGDGQSAELLLEVPDSQAAEKAEKNLIYVSPVIFPKWKDGAGNEYQDVITHVDFVNHPVDHSQGPFVPAEPGTIACAIRMGLAAPLRMSDEPDEKEKPADDDKGGDDDEGEQSPEDVSDESGRLKQVIQALAQMDIVLSEDTNTSNLLAHLHQALLTAAAHRGEGPTNNDAPAGGNDKTMVADPGTAALSLEARGTIAWAENKHREEVTGRLQKLLDQGQCTPAEFKTRQPAVAAVKLSLDGQGKPSTSDLEKWIESREAVPRGTFWDPDQRTRMSAAVEPAPEGITGEMSKEDEDAAVALAFGRKK